MSEVYSYFAPCPLGMEQPLAQEIRDIGIADVQPQRAGVAFRGSLSDGYRACIWSRLASRILLELGRFPAADGDSLYAGAKAFPWEEHMSPEATFAFEFTSARSAIKHTNFGALKTKDGLADRFRERTGQRPSVDRRQPDIRFHIHVLEDVAAISLDMSEVRLHRRSWRGRSGSAPLKENLAAGILYLSKWPILAGEGKALVDPMCGIGTLVIEAALMLTRTAPGVLAEVTGPSGWLKHDAALFKFLIREARGEDKRGQPCPEPVLFGYDNDPGAIDAARRNARQAGVENQVRFARRELALVDPVPGRTGLFVVNPPYGERLAANRDLRLLYRRLGMTLKQRFAGWTGQIFTGNLEAAKDIGLRASARHPLYNGTIECRLLSYPMLPLKDGVTVATGSLEFANRLRKNRRKLKNWLKQENVSCYRIYDADLPEFAMVVDVYGQAVHVQENERPDTVDPLKAESRLHDGLVAICDSLDMSPELVFVKQRRRQRGRSQYEKEGESETFIRVREGGLVFLVNLTDYYDTGLFLDHRPVRELLRQKAEGKRFLNLFAYTGSATVYAAAGGARTTTTVDLSRTYLDWAGRNLKVNGFGDGPHRMLHADVLQWLATDRGRYDLIFIDPPSFSNSKSMQGTFDVLRDHARLLTLASRRLSADGEIVFSANLKRFRLDDEVMTEFDVEDISSRMLPPDFARSPRIHHVFLIKSKQP